MKIGLPDPLQSSPGIRPRLVLSPATRVDLIGRHAFALFGCKAPDVVLWPV